jgi:hypothetical protein
MRVAFVIVKDREHFPLHHFNPLGAAYYQGLIPCKGEKKWIIK